MKKLQNISIALVLAGGGARGAYEVGVYKALHELGLTSQIKVISGTSIGAINSLLFASNDITSIDNAWNNLNYQRFLNNNDDSIKYKITNIITSRKKNNQKLSISDYFKSGELSITNQDGLKDFILEYANLDLIRNSPIDLYSCAYNLDKEEVEYFCLKEYSDEEIINIVLASSCVPILFKPININDNLYADGGCGFPSYITNPIDNTPVKPTLKYNCDLTIVVELVEKDIINVNNFPQANIIEIFPSANIERITGIGTINLNAKTLSQNIELGYRDAIVKIAPQIIKILST